MITINLYQPKQIDITVDFPSCWNELSQSEIKFIAKCLLTEADQATVHAQVLKFIIEARCTPVGTLARPERLNGSLEKDWFLHIDPEAVVIEVFPLLDFIFKSNDLTNTPPPFTFNKLVFYPQTFENITCAEYEDCEVIANKFANKSSQDLLIELAAILFRPASPSPIGEGRGEASSGEPDEEPQPYLKFNPRTQSWYAYKTDQKVKYFKTLPPEDLYAIFIWYAGNRAQLPVRFPTVYDGASTSDGPDLSAFTKCIHAGAGPKNGTRQQIRNLKLYEFMFDMEQEAIHAKELEAEIERMKNQH